MRADIPSFHSSLFSLYNTRTCFLFLSCYGLFTFTDFPFDAFPYDARVCAPSCPRVFSAIRIAYRRGKGTLRDTRVYGLAPRLAANSPLPTFVFSELFQHPPFFFLLPHYSPNSHNDPASIITLCVGHAPIADQSPFGLPVH
jgi:hypothetical protein